MGIEGEEEGLVGPGDPSIQMKLSEGGGKAKLVELRES